MRDLLILTLSIFCVFITNFSSAQHDRNTFKRSAYLPNKMAGGHYHTLEIRNGTLWAWGLNDRGQLGDGTNVNKSTPVQIGTANNWINIQAGQNFSVGIKSDGTLWAWGANEYGALGDNSQTDRNTPAQIGNDTNWVDVDAGDWHCIGLKSDGTIWSWGNGGYGELGHGVHQSEFLPRQIGTEKNWVSIAAGFKNGFAIKVDGTLWAWGKNGRGTLGIGSNATKKYEPTQVGNNNNWVAVDVGFIHAIGLQSDGTLWGWGGNDDGQVGDGTTTQRWSPVRIGNDNDWVSFDVGANHNTALKSDGTLWAWGRNPFGQLGNGSFTRALSPVQENTASLWRGISNGYFHSYAVNADGTIYMWGRNNYGQLGDGTTSNSNIPKKVNSTNEWIQVNTGSGHNFAIRADGSLWGWGKNTYNSLGNGNSVSSNKQIRIGAEATWRKVSTGQNHTLAIRTDGTLWAWGRNAVGELGDGTNAKRSTPVQIGTANDWVNVATGFFHSLALKSDGTLWSWGSNTHGQLGDTAIATRKTPAQVGVANNWINIAAGSDCSAGIRSDGTLWTWGDGSAGQIGDSLNQNIYQPKQVGVDSNWAYILVGTSHCLGLKADGSLWAWGDALYGQRGNTTIPRILRWPERVGAASDWITIEAGHNHSLGLKANGQLWAWGWNTQGQTGDGTNTNQFSLVQIGNDKDWVEIAAGHAHSLRLSKVRDEICSTGSNSLGELGDGTFIARNTFNCVCSPAYFGSQLRDVLICTKGDTYFEVGQKYNTTYKWQINDGSGWHFLMNDTTYSGVATNKLDLKNIDTAYEKYRYRCVTYKACSDSVISNAVKVFFPDSLSVVLHPIDSAICVQDDVKFWIGTSDTALTYQWQVQTNMGWSNLVDTGLYSGTGTDTLKLTAATLGYDSTKYRCVVTTCSLEDTSNYAMLYVDTFLKPKVALAVINIGSNQHKFFALPTHGGLTPIYEWRQNGNIIKQGIDSTITLTGLTPQDTIVVYMVSSERCVNDSFLVVNSKALTTSIIELEHLGTVLRLYPNPNNGTFTVELLIEADGARVSVYDILSREVYKSAISHPKSKIQLHQPSGIYLIKMEVDGKVFTERLMIE